MADPDLELRKGGGGTGGFLSLTLPAFLPFAILFILPKKEGGGAGLDLPLLLYSFSFPVYSCLLRVFLHF